MCFEGPNASKKCGSFTVAIILFASLAVFAMSWQSVAPTEYGLLYNKITGVVSTEKSYTSGRYLVGPTSEFIKFPATQVMLDFSNRSTNPPIDARTGSDVNDPDSGGQPVKLSLSIIYRMNSTRLGRIYRDFSTQYESRYVQFVRQAVSDVSQRFNPTMFWLKRSEISTHMQQAVNELLSKEGGAHVVSLQLVAVDFSQKYEDSIISIQLATQYRTTQEYQKQVVKAQKEIDILKSQVEAEITIVNANAAATKKLILNQASALGFNVTQGAKASSYTALKEALGLTGSQLMDYLRVKSVRTHNSDRLVVGIERIV